MRNPAQMVSGISAAIILTFMVRWVWQVLAVWLGDAMIALLLVLLLILPVCGVATRTLVSADPRRRNF